MSPKTSLCVDCCSASYCYCLLLTQVQLDRKKSHCRPRNSESANTKLPVWCSVQNAHDLSVFYDSMNTCSVDCRRRWTPKTKISPWTHIITKKILKFDLNEFTRAKVPQLPIAPAPYFRPFVGISLSHTSCFFHSFLMHMPCSLCKLSLRSSARFSQRLLLMLGWSLPSTSTNMSTISFFAIWTPFLWLEVRVVVMCRVIVAILECTCLKHDWPFLLGYPCTPFPFTWSERRVCWGRRW